MSERRLADDDSVRLPTRRAPRRRLIALAIYLALLAASSVFRARLPEPSFDPSVSRIRLTPGGADTLLPGDAEVVHVTLAFDRRCPPESAPRGQAVVLLHGSPGGRFDFHGVTDALARDRCVIAPDLPGFGNSTRDVPDYGVAAHAAYVDALLATLHESRAHVVGFSMGGGVAIEFARRHPRSDRVVDAAVRPRRPGAGAVRPLLGEPRRARRAVGGALAADRSHAALRPVRRDVHGGRVPRGTSTTPTSWPLRPALLAYDGPALIYHGRHDFLVPYEAALEHHRLLPQSVLVTSEGDHFDTFMRPREVASALVPFLAAVDRGQRPTRSAASPALRVAAERPYAGPVGYRPHGTAPRYRNPRGCRSPVDRCGSGMAAPSQTTAAEVKMSPAWEWFDHLCANGPAASCPASVRERFLETERP